MNAVITDDDTFYGWQGRAACRGKNPELWFPDPKQRPTEAKKVCAVCPVRARCLEVFFHEQHGVFGGLSPEERVTLRRGAPKNRHNPQSPFNPEFCGSTRGYEQHRAHRQDPCRPCKDAKNARRRQLRETKAKRLAVAA